MPVFVMIIALLASNHFLNKFRIPFVSKTYQDAICYSFLNAMVTAKRLLTLRRLTGGFLLGFLAWGAECTTLFVLAQIVPQTAISFGDSIGIYAAAIVVGAISFLPGGLGTTEAMLLVLLDSFGFVMSDALLLTLVCRLLTLWFAVGLGWASVGLLWILRESTTQ